MIHILEDEWSLGGISGSIDTRKLWAYVKYKQMDAVDVHLTDISHKPLEDINTGDNRYILADISYPLLIVKGMVNPHNKPYRMIDGRHRLLKHKLLNNNYVPCYVLLLDEVLPHVLRYK